MSSGEIERRSNRRALRGAVPVAVAVATFVAMAALFLAGLRPIYEGLLFNWGFNPWPFPFLDTDTILSALRCRRLGVDIFVANPCDALGRVFDYSPLWLAGAALPVTTVWIAPVGLSFVLLFFVALTLLPPGRGWRETAIITLGVISSASVFAVERGNNDLVVFALGAFAAALAARGGRARTVGYGCALLAGLLKYYPLALLGLALRERPGRFALVALAACVAVAAFIALTFAELTRALALIPAGAPGMFGAKTLPASVAGMFGLPDSVGTGIEALLLVGSVTIGTRLGARRCLGSDLDRLTELERMFLLAGSLLVIGCFVTAQNIDYRAILIVLLLPGLTALARFRERSNLFEVSTWVALLLLWNDMWRRLLETIWNRWALPGIETVQTDAWLLRELGWWWLITVLFGLLSQLLLPTATAQAALGWSRVRR